MTAADVDWLRTHVGHEVKYMTYAGAQFAVRSGQGDDGNVAMQDSALTRGRALLDFIRSTRDRQGQLVRDPENRHLDEFYSVPELVIWTPNEKAIFGFVSRALGHLGRDRDNPTGRWPGIGSGEGRNECLTRVVLISLENRFAEVHDDYRGLLERMVMRSARVPR